MRTRINKIINYSGNFVFSNKYDINTYVNINNRYVNTKYNTNLKIRSYSTNTSTSKIEKWYNLSPSWNILNIMLIFQTVPMFYITHDMKLLTNNDVTLPVSFLPILWISYTVVPLLLLYVASLEHVGWLEVRPLMCYITFTIYNIVLYIYLSAIFYSTFVHEFYFDFSEGETFFKIFFFDYFLDRNRELTNEEILQYVHYYFDNRNLDINHYIYDSFYSDIKAHKYTRDIRAYLDQLVDLIDEKDHVALLNQMKIDEMWDMLKAYSSTLGFMGFLYFYKIGVEDYLHVFLTILTTNSM